MHLQSSTRTPPSEGLKNVIYEGTPHGNAKLAYSEIILILNPISSFL